MAGLATEDIMAIVEQVAGLGAGSALDRGLIVQFDAREVPDEEKTKEFGYDQFKLVTYVKIFAAGEATTNVVHRPATHCGAKRGCSAQKGPRDPPCDVHRFPQQYAAFLGNLDQDGVAGLVLTAWPGANKAEVAMLKRQGIHTVEQLASIPDSALSNLGPIRSLRQRAIDYVESALGAAPLVKLRKELQERDTTIAAQQAMIEQLGKRMDELAAKMPAAPTPVAEAEPEKKRARG